MTRTHSLVLLGALITCAVGFPGAALGQYTPDQNVPTVEGVCVSNCGTTSAASNSTGDTWGAQLGTAINQWFRGQLSSAAGHDRASEINNRGVQLYNSGDWTGAIALYRQALAINPDSVNIRLNLMYALTQESARLFHSSNDAAMLARVEAMLNEVGGLDGVSLAGNPDRDRILQWIASGRREVANVRAAQQREAENARALGAANQRISSIAGDLAGQLNDGRRTSNASNLGFGDPSALGDLRDAPNDPVDARGVLVSLPPNLPRLEAVEHSPGREAWLRGMDAVRLHDWELATAWFQTARLRDPDNEALRNAVALSEWTRAYYRHERSAPATSAPPDPALRNPQNVDVNTLLRDPAVRTPQDSDLDLLFADQLQSGRADLAAALTPEERARIQAPTEADMALLGDMMADRARDADRLSLLFPSQAEQLQQAREALSEMSADEIREAQRTHSDPQFLTGVRQVYARDLAHMALVQAVHGDLDGAEFLLNRATEVMPESTAYSAMRDAFRGLTTVPASGPTGLAPGGEVRPRRD